MDLEACRQKMAELGPHPGLSSWHKENVLLVRCRDIPPEEFRNRYLILADKFERLLEDCLPEHLEPETYQLSAGYYDAVAACLESYLEAIDDVLHWSETGVDASLDSSRKGFARGDREWNRALEAALEAELQFQEIDQALIRSFGLAGY